MLRGVPGVYFVCYVCVHVLWVVLCVPFSAVYPAFSAFLARIVTLVVQKKIASVS